MLVPLPSESVILQWFSIFIARGQALLTKQLWAHQQLLCQHFYWNIAQFSDYSCLYYCIDFVQSLLVTSSSFSILLQMLSFNQTMKPYFVYMSRESLFLKEHMDKGQKNGSCIHGILSCHTQFQLFDISESLDLLIIKIVCRTLTLIFPSKLIKRNFHSAEILNRER